MARGRGAAGPSRGRGRGRGRLHGGGPDAVANAQASTEYNPAIRETREQIKGSRKREGDLGSWYRQLAADYGQARNAGSAALQSIEEATGKQLSEAGERSSADQARLASEDASFAGLTGGPKDTAGLSKIANAGAAASRAQVALNLPVEQQQANFVGRIGADKAAARLHGVESRNEERARRTKLKSDLAAKRQEKGAARVSAKSKLLEAAAARAAEAKKLTLEEQEAQTAARSASASTALARLKAVQEARQDAIGNRQAQEKLNLEKPYYKARAKYYSNGGGKSKGLSPGEKNTNRKERQNAAALVGSAVTQAGPPKTKAEAAELERLAVEAGGAAREVHRAVQKLLKQAEANRRGYRRRLHQGKIKGH